jgi:5-deoxy-5-amino-3-dehydroquinate synthase
MDIVLVGLPGSGKSVIGKRLAQRHAAPFIDLDERIETSTGRSIPEIFADDGEAAFRALERSAIADLGSPDDAADVRRVIATGGGAVVDPRNRWALYRGRAAVWLDGRPEVLAQRLRRSPHVRPLVSGRDPIGTIRDLAARRERFYAAAHVQQSGVAEIHGVVDSIERRLPTSDDIARGGTTLLRATTPIGRIVLGDGILVEALATELAATRAPRAILVSEPGAWGAVGERTAAALRDRGLPVEPVLLPQGEAAKRLGVVESAASELARLRIERSDVLVAIGGGALGDAAGFLAATYLRGVRFIQVPTTLVAQVDSSIGGKTGVDLPEGKNLVGAFWQPSGVVCELDALDTLPEREVRCGYGEMAKYHFLTGDDLMAMSLTDRIARCIEIKAEVVAADEREDGRRALLNYGHTLAHALEIATEYRLAHGEAVAIGLVFAAHLARVLDRIADARVDEHYAVVGEEYGLATELPAGVGAERLLDLMHHDKKARDGLTFILDGSDGVEIVTGVAEQAVVAALSRMGA